MGLLLRTGCILLPAFTLSQVQISGGIEVQASWLHAHARTTTFHHCFNIRNTVGSMSDQVSFYSDFDFIL